MGELKQVFPIAPAGGFGMMAPLLLLAPVLLLVPYLIYPSRNAQFELSPEGLRIRGGFYGRFIPAARLVPEKARALDLQRDTDYKMSWRTNGLGLPGLQAGWFRLKNGERALAFVTDKSRVVYVPTTDGYSVLMSVAEPEAFLAALQHAGPQSPSGPLIYPLR